MKSFYVLLITMCFNLGCGYSDVDGVAYQKIIIGNIELQTNESSPDDTSLVHFDGHQNMFIIVEKCTKVYYDSIDKNIYVERFLNEYNNAYYQVHVVDSVSQNPLNAFQKTEITNIVFDSLSKRSIVIHK